MVRGNNRNDIFHEKKDFKYFKEKAAHIKHKHNIKIFHYVLMNNHSHIVMQVPLSEDLSKAMKALNLSYSQYYRNKYGGAGHFFQNRFKSCIIQTGKYMLECGRYIERNPVSARIVNNPGDYLWSSYHKYTGKEDILVDYNPEYLGLSSDEGKRIKLYKDFVESRREEKRTDDKFFKIGAYGNKEFINKMIKKGLKPKRLKRGRPPAKKDEK